VITGTPPVLAFVLLPELLDALLDAVVLEPAELSLKPVSPAAEPVVDVADVEGIVPVAPDAAGNGPSVIVTT